MARFSGLFSRPYEIGHSCQTHRSLSVWTISVFRRHEISGSILSKQEVLPTAKPSVQPASRFSSSRAMRSLRLLSRFSRTSTKLAVSNRQQSRSRSMMRLRRAASAWRIWPPANVRQPSGSPNGVFVVNQITVPPIRLRPGGPPEISRYEREPTPFTNALFAGTQVINRAEKRKLLPDARLRVRAPRAGNALLEQSSQYQEPTPFVRTDGASPIAHFSATTYPNGAPSLSPDPMGWVGMSEIQTPEGA